MTKIIPIILSGGSGTRLWPVSRTAFPKQFLPLANETSLFEQTLERVSDTGLFEKPLILCAKAHRFLIRDILRGRGDEADILMEPAPRNTAPALMAAALAAYQKSPDSVMLVCPSDHYIPDHKAFQNTVRKALPAVMDGHIGLFGIRPEKPETGYGYIKQAGSLSGHEGIYQIEKFKEKPDGPTAESYLKDGGYLWNSGIFLMRAKDYIEELSIYAPDAEKMTRKAWENAADDLGDILLHLEDFEKAPDISIDFAVMEHTKKGCVIKAAFEWSDLGSWDAMYGFCEQDGNGNAHKGPVIGCDTQNTYLHSEGPLLCAADIEDIIAVATKDAVMITKRGLSGSVSKIVKALNSDNSINLESGIQE